jgi:DNA-binding CsgD family transcriptional regulator
VLERLAAGPRYEQIAYEIGISEPTLAVLIARAKARLGASTTIEAAMIFARVVARSLRHSGY